MYLYEKTGYINLYREKQVVVLIYVNSHWPSSCQLEWNIYFSSLKRESDL